MDDWERFDFGKEPWLRRVFKHMTAQVRLTGTTRQYRIVDVDNHLVYYGSSLFSLERVKRALEILTAVASAETTNPLGLVPENWAESTRGWHERVHGVFVAQAKAEDDGRVVFRILEAPTRSGIAVFLGTATLPIDEVKRGLDGVLSICGARLTAELPVFKSDDD